MVVEVVNTTTARKVGENSTITLCCAQNRDLTDPLDFCLVLN